MNALEGTLDLSPFPLLERVSLWRNELNSLVGLQHCSRLLYLDVSLNQLESIQGLGGCKQLREFNFSYNYLKSLPEGVRGLHRLQALTLTQNCMVRVDRDAFESLPVVQGTSMRRNSFNKC